MANQKRDDQGQFTSGSSSKDRQSNKSHSGSSSSSSPQKSDRR